MMCKSIGSRIGDDFNTGVQISEFLMVQRFVTVSDHFRGLVGRCVGLGHSDFCWQQFGPGDFTPYVLDSIPCRQAFVACTIIPFF